MRVLYLELDEMKMGESPVAQAISALVVALKENKEPEKEFPPFVKEEKNTVYKEEKITVRHNKGITELIIKDIVNLKGDGHSVSFFYLDGSPGRRVLKLITGKNLKNYMHLAALPGFFYCHQSYIVNLAHTEKELRNGKLVLTVNAKEKEIPIARNHMEEYKRMER